jgi:hypothetical protein
MSSGEDILYRHPGLLVARCPFGWGVFTTQVLEEHELIEECTYLAYARPANQTMLNDYAFHMEKPPGLPPVEGGYHTLVLGYGSLYNHSFENNMIYYFDPERNLYLYHAARRIELWEQLFINYGENWWKSRQRVPE